MLSTTRLSSPQLLLIRYHQASTSRHGRSIPHPTAVPSNCRSFFNPREWLNKKLSQKDRDTPDRKVSKEAMNRAVESGHGTIFHQAGVLTPKEPRKLHPPPPNARAVAKEALSQLEGIVGEPEPEAVKLRFRRHKNYVSKPSQRDRKPDFHKYSTRQLKISHRKLNLLARQIAGKPIDYAILQMKFSEKRISTPIMHNLATAKFHAVKRKKLQQDKLVVSEAWVTKAATFKKLEIKGRGRMGIREHRHSRMHVVLKEGNTYEEKMKALRERKLNKIRSAGLVREDRPLINVAPIWAW